MLKAKKNNPALGESIKAGTGAQALVGEVESYYREESGLISAKRRIRRRVLARC